MVATLTLSSTAVQKIVIEKPLCEVSADAKLNGSIGRCWTRYRRAASPSFVALHVMSLSGFSPPEKPLGRGERLPILICNHSLPVRLSRHVVKTNKWKTKTMRSQRWNRKKTSLRLFFFQEPGPRSILRQYDS